MRKEKLPEKGYEDALTKFKTLYTQKCRPILLIDKQ